MAPGPALGQALDAASYAAFAGGDGHDAQLLQVVLLRACEQVIVYQRQRSSTAQSERRTSSDSLALLAQSPRGAGQRSSLLLLDCQSRVANRAKKLIRARAIERWYPARGPVSRAIRSVVPISDFELMREHGKVAAHAPVPVAVAYAPVLRYRITGSIESRLHDRCYVLPRLH